MSYSVLMAILLVSFLISVLLTGVIRHYALKYSFLDIPNQRSSHILPTPRGGGLAIVLIVLISIFLGRLTDLLSENEVIALIGGGVLVGGIGWLDDHRDISAQIRAVLHFIAAIWTLYWLGGLSSIDLGFLTLELGWFGSVLAAIGIVWLINLYNFMDGTDGIASVQAISAGSLAVFLFLSAGMTGLAMITLAMLGATTGFLLWNWSPAKIFMGDVGSSFLGYFFGVLAILGEKSGSAPVLIWSILLALFFWDATLTLIYRFRSGEKWYTAHRSHAYQRLVQMGCSHQKLALYFLVINITILWPISWFAMNYKTSLLVSALVTAFLSAGLWLAIRHKYDKYHQ